MEPLMREENKRLVAAFVPYRKINDAYEFYLQKRDAGATTHPGMLSLFGGGIEADESPLEGLFREIKEELDYVPSNLSLFSRYETMDRIFYVFIEEVKVDFESVVHVNEGEYGVFLKLADIELSSDVTLGAQVIITELTKFLNN
jgi:8-oxo-dGTP pyrophosphatase MutT (NUDIX family)